MRVEIDAGGRKVTVDCSDTNASPKEVLANALAAWKDTSGAVAPSEGPAFGLASAERNGRQTSPMSLGGYGREYIAEPTAEGAP